MAFNFQYQVTKATTVKRLLAENGVSHRLLAKLIEQHKLWVNQQVAGNQPVAPGDVVSFEVLSPQPVAPSAQPVTVALELADWLVVVKPHGVSSVPGPSDPSNSLLNRVAGYLAAHGQPDSQPAIITRLDRDTTGLVLVAKHPFAQGRLDQLGVNAQVKKRYRALIQPGLMPASGSVDAPLGLAADGIHREVQADGQSALTQYQTVAQTKAAQLLEVTLVTGRTHQIRVHMQSLGHPLIGDSLYGGDLSQVTTQQLQAFELSFTDPFTGISHQVRLPVDATMARLLGN